MAAAPRSRPMRSSNVLTAGAGHHISQGGGHDMAATIEELKKWAAEHLTRFAQSAFRISTEAGRLIFIDPFRVPASAGPADLILVTHPHQDHYDKAVIAGCAGKTP